MSDRHTIGDELADRQARMSKAIDEGLPEFGIFWILRNRILQASVPWSESSGVVMQDRFSNGRSDDLRFWRSTASFLEEASRFDHTLYRRGCRI